MNRIIDLEFSLEFSKEFKNIRHNEETFPKIPKKGNFSQIFYGKLYFPPPLGVAAFAYDPRNLQQNCF